MPRNAIGIDIGGTHIRAARILADGTVADRRSCATDRSAEGCLALCLSLVSDLVDADTVGIGAGVPGQVDFARQVALSGGFVDLSTLPFAQVLAERTGLRVVIDNDANMALVAEVRIGALQGRENAVLLTIGTGIGGAILSGGRILRGRGTAGQLGHLVVDPRGRPCVCGRHGCVETESSGTAFATHLAEAGLPPELRAEALIGRMAQDAAARQVVSRWALPLRAAIDSLIATLAPEAVVIGGGAGRAALQALQTVPHAKSWFDAPVLPAALGDDAGVIGAALSSLTAGRRAVLVNGVPASGKSGVAAALSQATGWPVLSLDTIKTPFLHEFAPVDRPTNRRFGMATYEAIFDIVAQHGSDATVIIDAWFGFQPPEVLLRGLGRCGIGSVAEIWCHAPADDVADRYARRVANRPQGHPGLDYVPELRKLAQAARPIGRFPLVEVETTRPLDAAAMVKTVRAALGQAQGWAEAPRP